MFLHIKSLLTSEEIARLTALAQEVTFMDGRMTNSVHPVKQNLQAHRDPGDAKYAESVKIVSSAFMRSRTFCDFAMPKRITHPLLSRYEKGMKYGAHADSALMPMPPDIVLRSDLSTTVFISDPATYEGGELIVHMGSESLVIKGAPGDAVVYPSTMRHEVTEVTSGARLVSVAFIESIIADEHKRTQLYEMTDVMAQEGKNLTWANRVRMEVALQNLMRMWSLS